MPTYGVQDWDWMDTDALRRLVRLIALERDSWQQRADAGDQTAKREAARHSQKLQSAIEALKARSEP
jgi:hypothetical protein